GRIGNHKGVGKRVGIGILQKCFLSVSGFLRRTDLGEDRAKSFVRRRRQLLEIFKGSSSGVLILVTADKHRTLLLDPRSQTPRNGDFGLVILLLQTVERVILLFDALKIFFLLPALLLTAVQQIGRKLVSAAELQDHFMSKLPRLRADIR